MWIGIFLIVMFVIAIIIIVSYAISNSKYSDASFDNKGKDINGVMKDLINIKNGIANVKEGNAAIQRLIDIEALKVEYPSHERILNDSIKLIETTNNIDVLISRHKDVINEWTWMEEQYQKGMPIRLQQEPCGFSVAANRVANFHIVRIANYQFNKFKTEISMLKSYKAIEKRFINMFELIEKCESSLKHHENKFEALDELNDIRFKVEVLFQDYKQ